MRISEVTQQSATVSNSNHCSAYSNNTKSQGQTDGIESMKLEMELHKITENGKVEHEDLSLLPKANNPPSGTQKLNMKICLSFPAQTILQVEHKTFLLSSQ